MEIQVHKRLTLLLVLAAFMAVQASPALARKQEKADSLVRLMKAESIEQLMINGQQYRKAISSTFLHNGTYLISDTALWNVDTKVINAVGHVKVIQDETVLTSDKLDYFIDENLAQFRGTLVQLQNKKKNLLRTRHLDYNTKDSLATFNYGAAMRDEDGKLIESKSGYYSSWSKDFMFEDDVNMFSDSMFVKTNRLIYHSEQDCAEFPTYIDFWKDGNMLSAEKGWYDKGRETVFFEKNVHAMSEDHEAWSDTLYFYRNKSELLMLGNAQVQDPGREVTAVAERIHYNDTLSQVKLQRNAAVALRTGKDNQRDTIYMGADTLIYRTIRRCDIPDGTVKACESRLADIMTDPVAEYRRKAAAEAAAAAEEAQKSQGLPGGKGATPPGGKGLNAGGGKLAGGKPESGGKPEPGGKPGTDGQHAAGAERQPAGEAPPEAPPQEPEPGASPELPADDSLATAMARRDSLMAPLVNALAAIDSLSAGAAVPAVDSLARGVMPQEDSLAGRPATSDSLGANDVAMVPPVSVDTTSAQDTVPGLDTLSVADSLKPELTNLDTTKTGFVYGIRNVRIFRKDIQVRCDSMCFCDLDSVARFYIDPVVWNDGRRQYTSDSLMVLIGGGGPRKASLQSNAFVIIQEDEVSYDQIKGAEVLAYFDSLDSSLKRFDALGGSSAIFYLRENEAFATVNKVESKMLSGLLVEGDIDHVYYFEQPKNNAYPVVQLPEAERQMKGFNWRPDERPSSPEDITTLKVKPSQREEYEAKPHAEFTQADIYFPGYMPGILKDIALRDSLSRIPKPKTDTEVLMAADSLIDDSLPVRDTLGVVLDPKAIKDSLAVVPGAGDSPADTLSQADSVARADTLALPDSLARAETLARADSLSRKEEIDPLSVPTVDPKQKRKEERELRRKLRIAARDARIAAREARWAELDRQDSLKLEAKKQKELDKQRAKTLKILLDIKKQDARDEAKLQKYIEKYRKQYEREQKRKAAGKRSPATPERREIPTPAKLREQADGGDAVLGDYGSPDDDPVLRSGGVPGT